MGRGIWAQPVMPVVSLGLRPPKPAFKAHLQVVFSRLSGTFSYFNYYFESTSPLTLMQSAVIQNMLIEYYIRPKTEENWALLEQGGDAHCLKDNKHIRRPYIIEGKNPPRTA